MIRDEGAVKLMNGATMASSRATLVTIGQVMWTASSFHLHHHHTICTVPIMLLYRKTACSVSKGILATAKIKLSYKL